MKNRLEKLSKYIKKAVSYKYFIEEMALFIGIFLFIITNFLINFYFGMYSLSILLIGFSIFSFKFSRK